MLNVAPVTYMVFCCRDPVPVFTRMSVFPYYHGSVRNLIRYAEWGEGILMKLNVDQFWGREI